jgi:hypothetical protein
MESMNIQAYKDGNDIILVFKNADTSLENIITTMLSNIVTKTIPALADPVEEPIKKPENIENCESIMPEFLADNYEEIEVPEEDEDASEGEDAEGEEAEGEEAEGEESEGDEAEGEEGEDAKDPTEDETEDEDDNGYPYTKYTSDENKIVLVTYDNGTSFILNFNNYAVTAVVNGVEYTVAGYSYIIFTK